MKILGVPHEYLSKIGRKGGLAGKRADKVKAANIRWKGKPAGNSHQRRKARRAARRKK